MTPGETVTSTSGKDEDSNRSIGKNYEPMFKTNDWFVEPLLNFDADTSKMSEVYKAAAFWAEIAQELKSKKYPISEGIDNWQQFDTTTRQKGRMLDDFLEMLITTKLHTDQKAFEVLRVLLAQGLPYLEFKEKMSTVDFSLKCNTIWENDAVAYRCNTCALTPCMSLCEACFDANGHKGHDYTRFFSREGGACDCGNQDVIRESGNCKEHGDESKRPKYDMNDVCMAEYIVAKLLVRLFLSWRGWMSRIRQAEADFHGELEAIVMRRPLFDIASFTEKDAARGNRIIEFLQECSNYGGPMRLIVSEVLLDENLYKAITEKRGEHYDVVESGRVVTSLDWRTHHDFIDDKKSVIPTETTWVNFPMACQISDFECFSLLDELIFWINRQLFPQNLVNFGLSMLSEPGYRDRFAYRFFGWYPICGKVINDLCISQADHARIEDKVSPACSRAVHVTVQMLSSASLCKKLNEVVKLVKTIFDVTRYLICERLIDSHISLMPFNICPRTELQVVKQFENRIGWKVMTIHYNAAISQHGYWFVMGDIQNVLTHTALAVDAVIDGDCFAGSYMKMMCHMQGMSPVWRIATGNAQEMDGGEEVQKAYTLEFETLAVTLFNIVAAIQQENSIEAARLFFHHVLCKLEQWFQHLHPVRADERDLVWGQILRAQVFGVSFHLPLHRHISTALTHFMELDGFYDYVHEKLIRDETMMRLLILHPLRIQVARAEINCGMWIRNGAQARMSSLIYSQWNVSCAFQTPDIDLIRFCAAHGDKKHFLNALTTSFHLNEKIRLRSASDDGQTRNEFLKLVNENAGVIEEIMMNQTGTIPEKCSFNETERERIIELMYSGCNATQMTIDFRLISPENVEESLVLREKEQIDPMFWGMFKLVAELVVVRVNSGATSEEHYRSEMVNCMAMGNVPYSRLRGSISEKGSRGSEMIDRHFERILNEIGDFIQPNESANYLKQGTYQLKTSIWNTEICPIFFLMRSSSMKQAREVFSRMEARERKNAVDNGESGSRDTKMEQTFWIPFRLIDFDEKRRHRGIAGVYHVLLEPSFILHCIAVLTTEQNCEAQFHDGTIQMAVYLLTLGVKFAQEKGISKDVYHTPFRIKKNDVGTEEFHTVCSFMLKLLEKEVRFNDCLLSVFKNVLDGNYDLQKVTGGRMVYLARFVSILAKLSPECRNIVKEKINVEQIEMNKLAIQGEKTVVDPAKQAAKEAARRRMASIMNRSAQKSAQTMQKLMQTEGMTAAEIETIDPSQQNRELFECPICGEQDTPNTVEHPFGMLAKLSTNFLCEEQIDGFCEPIYNLLDVDRIFVENPSRTKTRRDYAAKRPSAEEETKQPEIAKVKPPLTGTDLKTCGHAAHIECFNAYRASLYDGRQRPADRREVGCPMCRFTVNIIVPIPSDKPYVPMRVPPLPLSPPDIWRVMYTMWKKSKAPVFQEEDKNVRYAALYSTRDGGGLSEVWNGRQNSADSMERQSKSDKSTVSTLMVAMAVAMVERSSVLRAMTVPERRKNGRNSLTAHIMAASMATSKDIDFDVTNCAIINLFAKVPENGMCSAPTVENPTERQSTSREDTPKQNEVAGMSSDEMAAMATRIGRKRPMPVEYDLKIIAPMFVLDPKNILVRMIALLLDNRSVGSHVFDEMASNIVRAIVGWVSAHTTLCLVLRLEKDKIRKLSRGELRIAGLLNEQSAVARLVAEALTYNQKHFEYITKNLASPDETLTDARFCETLSKAIMDILRFASELFHHCKIGPMANNVYLHMSSISLEHALVIMKCDASCLNPQERAKYWTLLHRNNLAWVSKMQKVYQTCISEPLTWKPRRILLPPRSFEELFTRYFHRECINCSKSPLNPVVCLFCSQLLCLDDCCRVIRQEKNGRLINESEIEAHASQCSSSSGLFLSITSSMVIVMRGKQAAIWGTVYLDSHKEEDRNLKRGKPLFLCESRFRWLEYDWAEQEWQRVFQWFNLTNAHAFINNIRDCHMLHN